MRKFYRLTVIFENSYYTFLFAALVDYEADRNYVFEVLPSLTSGSQSRYVGLNLLRISESWPVYTSIF